MGRKVYHFYGENGRVCCFVHDEFGFLSADQNQEGGSHGNVAGYEYVKENGSIHKCYSYLIGLAQLEDLQRLNLSFKSIN